MHEAANTGLVARVDAIVEQTAFRIEVSRVLIAQSKVATRNSRRAIELCNRHRRADGPAPAAFDGVGPTMD